MLAKERYGAAVEVQDITINSKPAGFDALKALLESLHTPCVATGALHAPPRAHADTPAAPEVRSHARSCSNCRGKHPTNSARKSELFYLINRYCASLVGCCNVALCKCAMFGLDHATLHACNTASCKVLLTRSGLLHSREALYLLRLPWALPL